MCCRWLPLAAADTKNVGVCTCCHPPTRSRTHPPPLRPGQICDLVTLDSRFDSVLELDLVLVGPKMPARKGPRTVGKQGGCRTNIWSYSGVYGADIKGAFPTRPDVVVGFDVRAPRSLFSARAARRPALCSGTAVRHAGLGPVGTQGQGRGSGARCLAVLLKQIPMGHTKQTAKGSQLVCTYLMSMIPVCGAVRCVWRGGRRLSWRGAGECLHLLLAPHAALPGLGAAAHGAVLPAAARAPVDAGDPRGARSSVLCGGASQLLGCSLGLGCGWRAAERTRAGHEIEWEGGPRCFDVVAIIL
eukprot:COSAG01_NODE_7084_length_3361_cov_1.822195_4_plen_301_part_00